MPKIQLTVNGVARSADVPQDMTLLEFLRYRLGLMGTKSGCEEGVCGSCTVHSDGRPVRSCMLTALSQAGKHITTIEGLAAEGGLHPVQKAFVSTEAYQCGYCTPGMIMEAAALLAEDGAPTAAGVRKRMQGHVCRCGMYNRIVDAVLEASREGRRG